MFFLTFLFIGIYAYEKDCDQRTQVFKDHGPSNTNGYFFINKTYGGFESCTVIKNNTEYRNLINNKFPCIYAHCNPRASTPWGCISRTNKECYNVEHIIPKEHNIPELEGCNVNIRGNLIMAYALWNTQLSNSHYNEKKIIYGNLFDRAYKSVYWCCKGYKMTGKVPIPDCSPTRVPTYAPI